MATEREHSGEGAEPKKGFKIVDRRRFNEDGSTREGPDVTPDAVREPAAAKAVPPAASQPAAKPAPPLEPSRLEASKAPTPKADAPQAEAPKKPAPDEPPGGLTFSIFVQSLAQQALMQMGLLPFPHGQRELHLEQARDTVDILQLLAAKTKGNLSAEEKQLLDTVLYELKMSWVEVQQAIARSKGAGMPRPPGR